MGAAAIFDWAVMALNKIAQSIPLALSIKGIKNAGTVRGARGARRIGLIDFGQSNVDPFDDGGDHVVAAFVGESFVVGLELFVVAGAQVLVGVAVVGRLSGRSRGENAGIRQRLHWPRHRRRRAGVRHPATGFSLTRLYRCVSG